MPRRSWRTRWIGTRNAARVWGGELLELARASFERILEAPQQLPSWVGDREYRRLVLERFPYSIIFTYDDAEVRIVAFAHGRRKPGYWDP